MKIEGQVYRIAPLDARGAQEWLDFAKANMPDPVREVVETAQDIPEGPTRESFLARHLDTAFDRKKLRGTLHDPDLEAFSQTTVGIKKMFGLLFKKHHSQLTEDQVYEIVLKGIEEHGADPFSEVFSSGQRVPLTEKQVEESFSVTSG